MTPVVVFFGGVCNLFFSLYIIFIYVTNIIWSVKQKQHQWRMVRIKSDLLYTLFISR